MQNTLIRAICSLRSRIGKIMRGRLGKECRPEDIIGNDEQGYHLRDCLIVEAYDEAGTLVSGDGGSTAREVAGRHGDDRSQQFSENQRWVLAQLAADVKLIRRDVEQQFGISERTARRVLGELSEARLIEFDRTSHPGFYRLK